MRNVLFALGAMYAFAALCAGLVYLLRNHERKTTLWVIRTSGMGVGFSALGFTFLLVYTILFPQENRAARTARHLLELQWRVDSVMVRLDSLERRVP